MRSSPQLTTDLFNQELDREYSGGLTLMVALAQGFGLALIIIGLSILKDLPWFQYKLAWGLTIFGSVALFGWGLYCWYDFILSPLKKKFEWNGPKPLAEARRKTRVLRATFVIIVLDLGILFVLILVTGGPGKSLLDPLVPIIPIIAIILEQPRRTVVSALFIGLAFVFFDLGHWFYHYAGFTHSAFGDWIYFSHRDPQYALAFALVTGGAVVLSMLEFFLYHRPEIGRNIGGAIEPLISQDLRLQGIYRSLSRGTKSWIKWLDHRGLPLADLSLVHPPDEILKQAVVLCAPYWVRDGGSWYRNFTRKRIARHITFLTFASHWIDDHFDALETYCLNEGQRKSVRNSSPKEILETHNPRLDELLKRMKRAVRKGQGDQVERAVLRIIYGGLMQNAETQERLESLLNDYVDFVSQNLSEDLRAFYQQILNSECPLKAWTTTKVVMELLDATSPDFSPDESEFFTLLYAPALYFHNSQNEAAQENFGAAFNGSRLPDASDMAALVDECVAFRQKLFSSSDLPSGRKLQLKLLLSLYGGQLKEVDPDIVTAYSRLGITGG